MAPDLNMKPLNMDAWSDGQMRSKIWLCRELERLWPFGDRPTNIWIYGAWYGTLAQFLLIRERIKISRFDLFDIDSEALEISKAMSTMWWLNKKVQFGFHHQDCREIPPNIWQEGKPDLVINTSCEHFVDYKWFDGLPTGQCFLLQSTNMEHPTHILRAQSLEDLKRNLHSISEIFYEGTLSFKYPHFKFERYMIFGKK